MSTREQFLSRQFHQVPATSSAKNYLRALLAESSDTELVAELRTYFNVRRVDGDTITAPDVSAAIRLLGGK